MAEKILFLVLPAILFVLLSPGIAVAAINSSSTITDLAVAIIDMVWVAAFAITLILWVVTGILFLTAQGAPDKVAKAKTALVAAAIGTIVVILAFSVITVIGNAITK